jgi:hypothetical protein
VTDDNQRFRRCSRVAVRNWERQSSELVPGRELHPLKSCAFHGAVLRQQCQFKCGRGGHFDGKARLQFRAENLLVCASFPQGLRVHQRQAVDLRSATHALSRQVAL